MIFLRLTRHVASIVTLLLAFGLSVFAQSQPPTPGALKSDGAKPNEQGERAQAQPQILTGTKGSPAFITITKTQEEAAQEQDDRKQQATTQRWTIGTGVVMAALTLALIVVGVLQWNAYRAQLAITIAIERAWISAQVSLENFGPDLSPRVLVAFKNIGHSPAHFKLSRLKLEIMPRVNSLPDVPDYGEGNALPAPATLMPGQEATTIMDENAEVMDAFHFDGVISGDAHLYIYGCCEYTDIMQPKITRVTRYGWRYDTRLSQRLGKATFVFPKIAAYNDAT